MKNIFIAVLIITSIALGAWCVNQQGRIKSQSTQLAQTETRLAAAQAQLNEKIEAIEHAKFSEAKAKILQETLTETTASVVEQSKKTEQLQQSLAAAETNNPMHGLAAMFKDPKMREMMKSQQKAFMGPVIDKQYAALFPQLNLTPEQIATVKDLLQKKMLAAADSGMAMLDDSLTASQRADLAKQIKSQTDDYDNQIKRFLGDENYQAFQSYEKTVSDRTAVGQFSDQLAGGATALSSEQQERLIQAMAEARNNFKWTADSNQRNPANANADFASMFTEDKVAQFAQDKEQFDQQFLTRAQQILTPEQLTAFRDFQKTQRELQIAGMKMAAQMFAPKSQ